MHKMAHGERSLQVASALPGRGRNSERQLSGRTDVPSTQKAPLMQGYDRLLSAKKRLSQ